MLLRTLLKPEDYKSYFGVGLISLGIAALSMLLGTNRLLLALIRNSTWHDFLQGLFTGFSVGLIIFSIVLSAKGLVFLRRAEG